MPRAHRADKRARARKPPVRPSDEWIELPPRTRAQLIEDLDAALEEAAGFAQALLVLGHGLDQLDCGQSEAIKTVARAAQRRLECAQDTWLDYKLATRRTLPFRRG